MNLKALLISLWVLSPTVSATECEQELLPRPRVVEMAVPQYPRMARISGITGTVRFLVKTNGAVIEKIVKSDGPPMLQRELSEFLKTWKFERHEPLEFQITFNMKRAGPSVCPPGKPDEIRLVLPCLVEMAFTGLMECDPVIPVKAP